MQKLHFYRVIAHESKQRSEKKSRCSLDTKMRNLINLTGNDNSHKLGDERKTYQRKDKAQTMKRLNLNYCCSDKADKRGNRQGFWKWLCFEKYVANWKLLNEKFTKANLKSDKDLKANSLKFETKFNNNQYKVVFLFPSNQKCYRSQFKNFLLYLVYQYIIFINF